MKKITTIISTGLLALFVFGCTSNQSVSVDTPATTSDSSIANSINITDFDLNLTKLNNKQENTVYSPLSIKYALSILSEITDGNSKQQIDNVLDGFTPSTYTNSEHLSLANLFIIKDNLADKVNNETIYSIINKYSVSYLQDNFTDPSNINEIISEKTLNLINDYFNDFDEELKFLIVNTLAIDMEWVNKIQQSLYIDPLHENYSYVISYYDANNPTKVNFNDSFVSGVEFGTVANKYDIISDLGEDNIINTIKEDIITKTNSDSGLLEYFLSYYESDDIEAVAETVANEYLEELKTNYSQYQTNTDYYFYDNDSVKVFAKDLQTYDDTTLQYVAIMPKEQSLDSYIDNLDKDELNTLIDSLIEPTYEYFDEGVITEIVGSMPIFNSEYSLDLNNNLQQLGITDVYDASKSDFSKINLEEITISANQKTSFQFSNDGIKAASVTDIGGMGAAEFYNYLFDVPVKTIDLTFNKPFLFLVRNKDSGEIFFVGTLYNAEQLTTTVRVMVDKLSIRADHSTDAKKVGVANTGDYLDATGNYYTDDDYTWYELSDGSWIADKDNQWIAVLG